MIDNFFELVGILAVIAAVVPFVLWMYCKYLAFVFEIMEL